MFRDGAVGRTTNRLDFASGTQESNSQWLYDFCTYGLGQLCQEGTIPGGPPNAATVVRTFSYEQYGRPETTTTTIGSDTYVAATTYEQFGQVFQRFDGAETYSGFEYQYTADGHLEAAIESRGSASVTVERYRITAKDARGQVTGLSKGGIDVSRTYAPTPAGCSRSTPRTNSPSRSRTSPSSGTCWAISPTRSIPTGRCRSSTTMTP